MEPLQIAVWIGIALCVVQSGVFSGLNLAMFGLSAIELQAKAGAGNDDAARLMELRSDSNFLLTTILWGNVSTNVLLTLLSDTAMAGVIGFLFSTVVITFGGEIIPQAYFSRHALKMATLLRPLLRFWQFLLFPIAKPSALMLDVWLGPEALEYSGEAEFREKLKRYIAATGSEMGRVEGIGALNFLSIDDMPVSEEGEPLDPESIIMLPDDRGTPVFPAFEQSPDDRFVRRVQASGKRWVIVVTDDDEPRLALDVDRFLRAALLGSEPVNVKRFCHRPIVVRDHSTTLESVLPRLNFGNIRSADDVIENDLILIWGAERRVITGGDLLGRLLHGIARPAEPAPRFA